MEGEEEEQPQRDSLVACELVTGVPAHRKSLSRPVNNEREGGGRGWTKRRIVCAAGNAVFSRRGASTLAGSGITN